MPREERGSRKTGPPTLLKKVICLFFLFSFLAINFKCENCNKVSDGTSICLNESVTNKVYSLSQSSVSLTL